MANYCIGLDFGTSQTKVCLLNKDSGVREFIKFNNDSYFIPSLITKKIDRTFAYGNELEEGNKYRYFKMSAAEDEDLIQVTNENLQGNLVGNIDDYRKYSTDSDIKPEILVLLYLSYIYLFVKAKKNINNSPQLGGLLGALAGKSNKSENTFSINLGIPTEWHNPEYSKRKIKFESLLISAVKLGNKFADLDTFLKAKECDLIQSILEINGHHITIIDITSHEKNSEIIKKWLEEYQLSVFPESAAGINYLLQDGKLKNTENNYVATLDIGAGTSDLAIFELNKNKNGLRECLCSESVAIASNDFYKVYASSFYNTNEIKFGHIKEIENLIRKDDTVNSQIYSKTLSKIRGDSNSKGIEFAIRKAFLRKYYKPLLGVYQAGAYQVKNNLNEAPIIIFGGGSNLNGFLQGNYYYFPGTNALSNNACYFVSKPISNYVQSVDIADWDDVEEHINLLILALGLTYNNHNDMVRHANPDRISSISTDNIVDRYFYYDVQDSAFK